MANLRKYLKKEYYGPVFVYMLIALLVQMAFGFFVMMYKSNTADFYIAFNKYYNEHSLIISLIALIIMTLVIFIGKMKKCFISSISKKIKLNSIFIVPFSLFAAFGLNAIMRIANLSSSIETDTSFKQNIILQVIVLGILTPIVEELIFRGVIYNRMKKILTITMSAFISSILFSILHFSSTSQMGYTLALGLLLIFIYETYEDIKMPILMHICCNLTSIIYNNSYSNFLDNVNVFICMLLVIALFIVGYIISASNKHNGLRIITENAYATIDKEKEQFYKDINKKKRKS